MNHLVAIALYEVVTLQGLQYFHRLNIVPFRLGRLLGGSGVFEGYSAVLVEALRGEYLQWALFGLCQVLEGGTALDRDLAGLELVGAFGVPRCLAHL